METLLKQLNISGRAWRGVFLTGALPASVCMLVLTFEFSGWGGCTALLQKIFEWKADGLASVAGTLLATATASVILYAARMPIFEFFQTLPVWKLHEWRLNHYSKKRKEADFAVARCLWQIDVARWKDREFEEHAFVDERILRSEKPPDEKTLPGTAQSVFAKVANPANDFRDALRKELMDLLGQLHIATANRTRVVENTNQFTSDGNWLDAVLSELRQLYKTDNLFAERVKSLDDSLLYDYYSRRYKVLRRFPAEAWIAPTEIGNTLSALDDYATQRYGIDTSTLWSRVVTVLSDEQRDALQGSQTVVSLLLNLTVALVLLSVASAGNLIYLRNQLFSGPFLAGIAVTLSAPLLAWLSLRSAEYAANQMRQEIESLLDRHVLRWLRALGLAPNSLKQRNEMLAALGGWLNGATPDVPDYPLTQVAEPSLGSDKDKA
jgi:hypothetical protein